jgi:TetR/AcrR family transcriptional repressor of lmrAB and yxaGH operons
VSKDSKAKMVRSAASLIGSRGVTATSFAEVVADSGAPRGSIYHHFPDGKRQLAEHAVRWTSQRVLGHQSACAATTPEGVLDSFFGMWRNVVVATNGAGGCVVAGVAVDTAAEDTELIDLVRFTFRSWVDLLTSQLEKTGVPARRAASIAVAALAGMEGALILCRAEGGPGPLDDVASELKRLLP